MATVLRLIAAAVSGAVGALAFPPVGWWPLVLVGVAGLTLAVRGRSAASAALLGFVAGLGFFLPVLSWERVVAVEAWLALATIQALAWVVLGATLALVQRLPAWPLWAACAWVLVELVRNSVPFGGFSWARLAFGVTDAPMLGWAALGGAAGLTFAVAGAGQLLASAVLDARRARGRALLGAAGAGALVVGGSLVPLPVEGRPVVVAAIQGDVPRLGVGRLGEPYDVLLNHVAQTEALADLVAAGEVPPPDLVVWPESGSDVDPFAEPRARALLEQAVAAVGVPVLVGTTTSVGGAPTNSGIVWDPATGPGERYDKRHLVPFGEYIPLRPVLAGVSGLLALVARDLAPGTTPGVLPVGPVVVGDVICFEVAFDPLVRDVVDGGADLLVVQTNNATYGATAQPDQQFAISRLRAVEHGRALVVAATTGTSGVVLPDGTVTAATAQHQPAVVVQTVPLRTASTVADAAGPWPERVAAALAVLAALAGVWAGRRARRAAAPGAAEARPGRLAAATTPRGPGGRA